MESVADVYRTFELAAAGDGKSLALLAAIYVSAVMLSSAVYLRMIWHWPSTTAQLIRHEVAPFGGKAYVQSQQNYLAKVAYTYEVDGLRYTGHRLSPWKVMANVNARNVLQMQMRGIEIDPAGEVKVYYNPRKPAKSYLIRSGPIKQAVTLLAGIAPLVAYAWYVCGWG